MTTLAGVLGWPVSHSRSPAMHNAAYEALGLDWRYLPLPVAPERFEETVRALPGSGYRGANVTVPHKLAALAAADRATDSASAIGAANSLSFEDGRVVADNTDAGGLLDALAEPVDGLVALVLGAGGAARAAAWALAGAGAVVKVWNRTPERARELAGDLGVATVESPFAADLVINCTTVGLDPGVARAEALTSLHLDGVAAPRLALDAVYRRGETPFATWATSGGSRLVDGLELLVCQGARSFSAWTGEPAPLEVMRAAARSE